MTHKSLLKDVQKHYKWVESQMAKEKRKSQKELREEQIESNTESGEEIMNFEKPKKQPSVEQAKKAISTREKLREISRQTRLDVFNEKDVKEKAFEPITKRLDQVDQDIKNLDLIPIQPFQPTVMSTPIRGKIQPALPPAPRKKKLNFESEDFYTLANNENDNTGLLNDSDTSPKSLLNEVSYQIGPLARNYAGNYDDKFGIYFSEGNLYIGNKKVQIKGDDIIIDSKTFEGTPGLWKLLTKPKHRMKFSEYYQDTKDDVKNYAEILILTDSMFQNNLRGSQPKSSTSAKWKNIVSDIWKEYKNSTDFAKDGSGLIKYSESQGTYKFDNYKKLMERLMLIYGEEQAGNNNFDREKEAIKHSICKEIENLKINGPKGTEEIIKVVNSLPKRFGSGILNSIINNLPVEMHLPGYKFCGPGTKLEKRLARGDVGINKLDEGCRKHDEFYRDNEDVESRHVADKELEKVASEVIKDSSSTIREKVDAGVVKLGMKTKRLFEKPVLF